MVGAYAVALVIGLLGLIVVVFGGTLSENLGREDRDPGKRIGRAGRTVIGGLVGFGMAGLSAEFSPLGLATWAVFALALLGASIAAAWAAFASDRAA